MTATTSLLGTIALGIVLSAFPNEEFEWKTAPVHLVEEDDREHFQESLQSPATTPVSHTAYIRPRAMDTPAAPASVTAPAVAPLSSEVTATLTTPSVVLVLAVKKAQLPAYTQVVHALVSNGLNVDAIPLAGGGSLFGAAPVAANSTHSIALRVTAPPQLLESLRHDEEVAEGSRFALPPTPADRIRLLHSFVTTAKYNGGCGVLVGGSLKNANRTMNEHCKWVGGEFIVDCLVLHDRKFQQEWIDTWTKDPILQENDLAQIQLHLGERVAFYFNFLHFYVQALIPIAICGFVTYFIFPAFNPGYATALPIWAVGFTVLWKRREVFLAESWGAKGASKTDKDRPEFIPDGFNPDPVTGELIPFYPFWKRWAVHLGLTLPMVVLFSSAVVFISTIIISVEVYMETVYQGPYKAFGSVVPIVIYGLSLPLISMLYFMLSKVITNLENSQSKDSHMASLSRKSFIMTLSLIQLPLFLSGLVFIPFSDFVLPLMNDAGVKGIDITAQASNVMSPASLQRRVIDFAVMSQLATQVMDLALPPLIALVKSKVFPVPAAPAALIGSTVEGGDERQKFIRELAKEIQENMALPEYNIYDEYAKVANQFALLVAFSSAWPLVGLCCLFNVVLEIRINAWKICKSVRRPLPQRTESITPWADIFNAIALGGTLITTLLTALYARWDLATPASQQVLPHLALFLGVLIAAEHGYMFLRWIAKLGMSIVYGDLEALGEQRRRFVRSSNQVRRDILVAEGGDEGIVKEVEDAVDVVERVFATGGKQKEE
ncbi:hypothetical protein HDU81_009597 [Chytriomyces hyalinus]|nr:hypothetical protein HDU81_009597 [Chytriomyces hyalinus]